MKKSTIIGKRQILFGLMVFALAGAVFINMKYSAENSAFSVNSNSSSKTLGETTYVNVSESSDEVITTSTNVDYFETAKSDRNNSRDDSIKKIKETINNVKVTEQEKKEALENLNKISERMESENSIETLIKAKGFKDALAVISDENINIIVKSEKLSSAQSVQIQDIVTSQINVELEKIKIITVK